jgi:hypothetical protein
MRVGRVLAWLMARVPSTQTLATAPKPCHIAKKFHYPNRYKRHSPIVHAILENRDRNHHAGSTRIGVEEAGRLYAVADQ